MDTVDLIVSSVVSRLMPNMVRHSIIVQYCYCDHVMLKVTLKKLLDEFLVDFSQLSGRTRRYFIYKRCFRGLKNCTGFIAFL